MKTTDELLKVLKNSKSIEEFVHENIDDTNNATFLEYLRKYLADCGMTKSKVIEKSNIQKNYCYQIFDGSKTPSRNKVLALSIEHLATPEFETTEDVATTTITIKMQKC